MFAVALLMRVGYAYWAVGPSATPYSDAADYDDISWNLANDHGFARTTGGTSSPTAFRPPVVPWITSLLYRAVGHRYFAAVLLQCVIGALIPLMVGSLAGTLFGRPAALPAAWLAAFDPLLVFFSGYLLTEIPFAATLMLALLATFHWVRTPRLGRALGAGLLWGLAILSRPTALLMPALVAVWSWVPMGLTVQPRERVRQLIALGLGVVLVVAPWTLRNAIVFKHLIPVTTGGGRAFLDSNNPLVWEDPAMRGGAIGTYQIEPYASRFRGLSEPQADALASKLGWEYVRERVGQWPSIAMAKLGRFWRLRSEVAGTGSWRQEGGWLSRLTSWVDPLAAWSLVCFPLALWGAVHTLRGPRRWFQSLILLSILYFTLLSIVYWGSLRMRVPIQPLVMLLAGFGFSELRRQIQARTRGLKLVRSEPS